MSTASEWAMLTKCDRKGSPEKHLTSFLSAVTERGVSFEIFIEESREMRYGDAEKPKRLPSKECRNYMVCL